MCIKSDIIYIYLYNAYINYIYNIYTRVHIIYIYIFCFLMQSWRVGLLVSAAGDRTEECWYGVGVDGKTPPVPPCA